MAGNYFPFLFWLAALPNSLTSFQFSLSLFFIPLMNFTHSDVNHQSKSKYIIILKIFWCFKKLLYLPDLKLNMELTRKRNSSGINKGLDMIKDQHISSRSIYCPEFLLYAIICGLSHLYSGFFFGCMIIILKFANYFDKV